MWGWGWKNKTRKEFLQNFTQSFFNKIVENSRNLNYCRLFTEFQWIKGSRSSFKITKCLKSVHVTNFFRSPQILSSLNILPLTQPANATFQLFMIFSFCFLNWTTTWTLFIHFRIVSCFDDAIQHKTTSK